MINQQQKNSESLKGLLLLLFIQVLLVFSPSLLRLIPDFQNSLSPGGYYLISIVQEVLFFCLPALWVFARWKKQNPSFLEGLWTFPPWKTTFLIGGSAVIGSFFFYFVSALWVLLLEKLGIPLYGSSIPLPQNNWEFSLALVAVSIVPAFCEELFFRGFLLNNLRRSFSLTLSVVFTSLLFALSHRSLVALPVHLFLGFLLTALTAKSGSLSGSIIYHLVHNAVNLLTSVVFSRILYAMPQEAVTMAEAGTGTDLSPLFAIFSFLLFLLPLGFAYIILLRKSFSSFAENAAFTPYRQQSLLPKTPSFLTKAVLFISLGFMALFYFL